MMFLFRFERRVDGEVARTGDIMLSAPNREAAAEVVREQYELPDEVTVKEIMGWPDGRPVQVNNVLL